ncbi:insoluble domain protein (plasmid) [Rhodococcus pyridinivorans]|uniref:insoluble domain protein n=1 Tax=Rhodococcus pyridinivorans TaxID=103816 RepID=UPI0021645A9B|nr:insoluble domain protein [Rhodococcus pyridinivorans]UVT27560.1 insoluble domain protein [Rhodococcus pyridinivorans]
MSIDTNIGNRAARRAQGRHRRRSARSTATALAVASAAFGMSAMVAGPASAEPIQGGVTGGTTQEGVTSGAQTGGTTAAETPAPSTTEPKADSSFWVAPPTQYNQGTRAYDPQTGGGVTVVDYSTDYSSNYSGGGGYSAYTDTEEATPAVDWSRLHAPTPVLEPTVPIQAPKDKMRMGRVVFEQPNWVSDIDAERTNNTTAVIEAQVTDAWRSVGLETTEAERIASAQVAGTALGAGAGAATGCAAVGVPTSLVVGTVAGIGGALAGTMVPLPIPGAAPVTSGVAATALGAAGGLGVGCAIGGGIGAGLGGAAGFAAGTAYGAGEDATPIEAEVPDVEADAVGEQVDATLEQWSQDPIGQVVVDAVQTFTTETAPAIDTQVRDVVQAQPGGEQIVEQVDQTLETFFNDATPGLAGNLISNAIGDGITQFGI